MNLRAAWKGDLPLIGDVLRSSEKSVYLIIGIKEGRVVAGEPPTRYATFEVDKIAAADIPRGAAVHRWSWDRRDRRSP